MGWFCLVVWPLFSLSLSRLSLWRILFNFSSVIFRRFIEAVLSMYVQHNHEPSWWTLEMSLYSQVHKIGACVLRFADLQKGFGRASWSCSLVDLYSKEKRMMITAGEYLVGAREPAHLISIGRGVGFDKAFAALGRSGADFLLTRQAKLAKGPPLCSALRLRLLSASSGKACLIADVWYLGSFGLVSGRVQPSNRLRGFFFHPYS